MARRSGTRFRSGQARQRAALYTIGLALGAMALALWSCQQGPSLPTPPWEPSAAPTRSTYREEPDIRVRIRRGVDSVRLAGPHTFAIRPVGGGRVEFLPGPLVAAPTPEGIRITTADGAAKTFEPRVDLEVLSAAAFQGGTRDGTIQVEETFYPGLVMLRSPESGNGGRLDVVVQMGIETYLPGVVVKEMWPRWPRGAYEVQAVCARTYALHERERARVLGRAHDVEATTEDQVYGGLVSSPAVLEAVKATAGWLIYSGDELLRAYYSSTCGGRPGSAADTWPTGRGFEYNLAPPIQGRAREFHCQPSTRFTWTAKRHEDELSRRIRAWGANNGKPVRSLATLRSVEVLRRNAAERHSRYRLTDSKGVVFELSGEELRLAGNFGAGLQPVTREQMFMSGDVEVDGSPPEFTFRGKGFGHGVGMCQWCAKGMAERGMGWRQMVETFYPGATLRKAY